MAIIWSTQSTTPSVNVYYCTRVPQEVATADALTYLQNNSSVTGHYLMNNVNLIAFETTDELRTQLQTYIQSGGKIAVNTSGSEILTSVVPLLQQNSNFQLLNMFSTALLDLPPNIYRFAITDSTTFTYVIDQIPTNTIVYYDPLDVWSENSAIYFQTHGFEIISYPNPTILPSNVPYLIIATGLTPNLIDNIPATCPKLYGLDGSIFYPLTGTAAEKANVMQFECIQYSPPVTSPLIQNVENAIGKDTSYIFPCTLDAINYSRYYLNGFSNNTIQETTSGFSGSLIFENNERAYGNLVWYTFSTNGWTLQEKILLDTIGSCMINA